MHPLGSDLLDVLDRHGVVPLPPYITEPLADPERYQTTYADRAESVAAPTAGLHLTPELLEAIAAAGRATATVELVVGLGTFRPIAVDRVEDHRMHAERYRVPAATLDACAAAARVVAVGTTTVRALESAAATGELEGRTDLFIHGDRPFARGRRAGDELPPAAVVAAGARRGLRRPPLARPLRRSPRRPGYRFLSFGDAMFLRGERG